MSRYIGHDPLTPAEHYAATALREHRRKVGLSLKQVETQSGGVWNAVVVGSYERGDRRMSLGRFLALCEFYGLLAASLLSTDSDATVRARFLDELADDLRECAAALRANPEAEGND